VERVRLIAECRKVGFDPTPGQLRFLASIDEFGQRAGRELSREVTTCLRRAESQYAKALLREMQLR